MGLRLNLGCGTDVRPGWINVDTVVDRTRDEIDSLERGETYLMRGDMTDLSDPARGVRVYDDVAEIVLVNHALHALTYDEAERAFDEWVRVLAEGGRIVIVDADVIGVLEDEDRSEFVEGLISDELEPTVEGKVLRWAAWFGERRSLWSYESVAERLTRRGLFVEYGGPADHEVQEWAGNRGPESFVVIAVRLP